MSMTSSPPTFSLEKRILGASLVLLPAFFLVGAFMLTSAFKLSMETALQNQMQSQIYAIMSEAEVENGQLWMPPQTAEPNFTHPNSGQFAWIASQQKLLWRSDSSQLIDVPNLLTTSVFSAGSVVFYKPSDTTAYYQIQHDVLWQEDDNNIAIRFVVAHDATALNAELAAFQYRILLWLSGLTLLLIASQLVITRWGLKPLAHVADELTSLETGQTHYLEGRYPKEISQVTDNLNQVLRAQRQQRERYKNTLADLAHSLKTPLAIIKAAQAHPNSTQITEQINRMDGIISHQLNRAHLGHQPLSGQVALAPLVTRIINALTKLPDYAHMDISMNITDSIRFQGETGDMMEIMGNLIENGCKYGKSQLSITATQTQTEIQICIEDDGAGITPTLRHTILQRGARADTATSGQGIGLAVVVDILSSYGGELDIYKAALGGAGVKIRLPYHTIPLTP